MKFDLDNVQTLVLAGIRDKLIHSYFGVNLEVVWLSVKEGIPEAKSDIKRILDEM